MEFAEAPCLAGAVGDIEVRQLQDRRRNLVLVLGVRPHRGQVLAGGDETGMDQRLGGGRCGDQHVRTRRRLRSIGLRAHHDAELFAQFRCRPVGLERIACPDARFLDRANQFQCFQLQAGLHAGAVDSGDRGILAREVFGSRRPGGGRAHVGQVAIVEQQRLDQPGRRRQQDHHAVGRGQADLRIVEETGADLDGKAVKVRHIGRLHVDLAMMFGNVEAQDRRHRHRQGGERPEGVLHTGDGVEVQLHDRPEIGLGEDRHAGHAARSRPSRHALLTMSRCRFMSMFLPDSTATSGPLASTLPASRAAMPTAPAPSTTSRSSA